MSREADKNRMVARYLRGAKREDQRADARTRKARKAAAEPDSPQSHDRGEEDWQAAWFDERPNRNKRRLHRRTNPVVEPSSDQPLAVVLTLGPGTAELWLDGDIRSARLDKDLRRTQQTSLAVGDEVGWHEAADGVAVVDSVSPRRSSLARPDPANPHRKRVLVANVDRAAIVLSLVQPPLRIALADRLIVALSVGRVRPVLCVNKVDLADTAERERAAAALSTYEQLGIPTILASAETGDGIDSLRTTIRGGTTAFIGHSGVGKSALLNRLDPARLRPTIGGLGDGDPTVTTVGPG